MVDRGKNLIEKKWPGLLDSDMVTDGLNPVCETMVWSLTFRVKNVFEKKWKKPDLWVRGMVTGGPGQKPDWKKMTRSVRQWYGHWRVKLSLWDHGMVTDV